jgi:PncC family amidohydrolase
MSSEPAARLLQVLRGSGLSLATAESLTGGGLGALLTSVPGASEVYVGGVVCYATRLKTALLGISPALVAEHGVVSAACAEAMAVGARRLLDADVALSTTGVAGPDPQEGHPAGTVFVACAGEHAVALRRLELAGDRAAVRDAATAAAVELALSRWGAGPPGGVAAAR